MDLGEEEIRKMIARYLKIKEESITYYYLANFTTHKLMIEYKEDK